MAFIPPPGLLVRQVSESPEQWSEIYKNYREGLCEDSALDTLDTCKCDKDAICVKCDTFYKSCIPKLESKLFRENTNGICKRCSDGTCTDCLPDCLPPPKLIRKNTNDCDICYDNTCRKCLLIPPLSTCPMPLNEDSYDLFYINHYGLDAYLNHVYGNVQRNVQLAHKLMLNDDVYVAQNLFIENEYFRYG